MSQKDSIKFLTEQHFYYCKYAMSTIIDINVLMFFRGEKQSRDGDRKSERKSEKELERAKK